MVATVNYALCLLYILCIHRPRVDISEVNDAQRIKNYRKMKECTKKKHETNARMNIQITITEQMNIQNTHKWEILMCTKFEQIFIKDFCVANLKCKNIYIPA